MIALFAAALWIDEADARDRRGHRQFRHKPHSHGRIVFYAAPVFIARPYYPAPVYYAPPPAPTQYIEQPQQGYWHYCPGAGAYYPQVQTCPGGWQLVPPQPRTD